MSLIKYLTSRLEYIIAFTYTKCEKSAVDFGAILKWNRKETNHVRMLIVNLYFTNRNFRRITSQSNNDSASQLTFLGQIRSITIYFETRNLTQTTKLGHGFLSLSCTKLFTTNQLFAMMESLSNITWQNH